MKPDWNAIRAEYIGGGVSQRELAAKYGVKEGTLLKRANAEGWADAREKARNKSITRIEQRVANAAADNATLAADIKRRLLQRIADTDAAFPKNTTEYKTYSKGVTTVYKLKDLTAAFRDITADITPPTDENELRRIKEILGAVESVIE